MDTRSLPRPWPEDWVARALVSGFIAATAMFGAFLLTYALAAALASVEPRPAASLHAMQAWFRGAAANPLVDLSQSTVYLVVAAQLGLALLGAVVFGWIEPRWHEPSPLRGATFALGLWLVNGAVLLPLAGGGMFGTELRAGPLPMLGPLVAYLVYGLVLETMYGPFGDRLLGPATVPERQALRGTVQRGAAGLVGGMLVGALLGLMLSPPEAAASQTTFLGLPQAAVVLVLALVGGGWGMQLGALAGLVTPEVEAAVVGVERVRAAAAVSEAVAVPARVAAEAARPRLRVIAANGACRLGYQPGDVFTCDAQGRISPALCPAAADALRPLVAAMVAGKPDAPRSLACPIYEHMLAFELAAA